MSKLNKLLCFCLLVFAAVSVFAQQSKPINWSLGLQNIRTGELIPFSTPVKSYTGEKFRLLISPEAACYAYVVAESPDGEVGVLYSGALKGGEAWYSPIMELAAPKGSESLFIVVSRSEQGALAQRITALASNSSSTQRRALMNEVFRLRSDISKFKEDPEKPVLMGGASRGNPDKSRGVEYSGLEAYVKTISLEH